ncbi:ribosomal prt S29 [Enterospora canceri]|uniref:Ribosomal prt S29 n=1 Tax=Enterospora canceri TaxID=1081671 RepID=A0A1Y1S7X9_9MICR|nr:ribosomal prt S29 [Enterospora canceri]
MHPRSTTKSNAYTNQSLIASFSSISLSNRLILFVFVTNISSSFVHLLFVQLVADLQKEERDQEYQEEDCAVQKDVAIIVFYTNEHSAPFLKIIQQILPMINDLKVRKEIDKTSAFCHKKPFGKGSRRCERCANHRGFNRKHGMNLCRRCLHIKAEIIGFKSLD